MGPPESSPGRARSPRLARCDGMAMPMVVRAEQEPASTAGHGVVVSVPLSGARHAPFPKRCEYLYMTSSSRIARLAWPVLLLAALAFPAIASAHSGDHVTLGAGAGVVHDHPVSDSYRFLPDWQRLVEGRK